MIERLFCRMNPCNKLNFLSREAADCLVIPIPPQLLLNDFFLGRGRRKKRESVDFYEKVLENTNQFLIVKWIHQFHC